MRFSLATLIAASAACALLAGPAQAAGVSLSHCGASVRFHGHDAILVEARINGRGPYEVIFDTGANTIISDTLARELEIGAAGRDKLQAFAGTVASDKAVVKRFEIGPLAVTDLPVHVVAFPYGLTHIARRPIVAAIGADLIDLMAIRIDNTAHRLSFCPSAQFTPPAGVAPVGLHADPDGWTIDAKLDGEPGRFGFDTGQDLSLAVYAQAVKDRDLVKRYHATAGGVTGQGFGGQTTGWFARAPAIEIGGLTVHNSVVRLATDTAGIGTGAATGNFGMGVFKRFTVTLDGAHGHAFFQPNAAFATPDVYNRAGLRMEEQADGAHVVTVFPHSPASEAGLRQGDVILAADGVTPAAEDDFDAVFLKPVGTRVRLKVRSWRAPVRVTLRDVL